MDGQRTEIVSKDSVDAEHMKRRGLWHLHKQEKVCKLCFQISI